MEADKVVASLPNIPSIPSIPNITSSIPFPPSSPTSGSNKSLSSISSETTRASIAVQSAQQSARAVSGWFMGRGKSTSTAAGEEPPPPTSSEKTLKERQSLPEFPATAVTNSDAEVVQRPKSGPIRGTRRAISQHLSRDRINTEAKRFSVRLWYTSQVWVRQ
jgi:hypothetical protein